MGLSWPDPTVIQSTPDYPKLHPLLEPSRAYFIRERTEWIKIWYLVLADLSMLEIAICYYPLQMNAADHEEFNNAERKITEIASTQCNVSDETVDTIKELFDDLDPSIIQAEFIYHLDDHHIQG